MADEHAATLASVLARYGSGPLPRFHGELNRSALAVECGFDRKVFATNPRCADLLKAADDADRSAHVTALARAELVREERSKTDKDRSALEARVLVLEAENVRLRGELRAFSAIERIMTETGKMP